MWLVMVLTILLTHHVQLRFMMQYGNTGQTLRRVRSPNLVARACWLCACDNTCVCGVATHPKYGAAPYFCTSASLYPGMHPTIWDTPHHRLYITTDALQPDYAGVRPKLVGPGEPAADFVVQGAPEHGVQGLVNLYGIESPGLTASLALARVVEQSLRASFEDA